MQKEKFIDFLSSEKRFSKNTIISYSVDLDQFFLFLMDKYQIKDEVSDISFQIVRNWIATLEAKISISGLIFSFSSILLGETLSPPAFIHSPFTVHRACGAAAVRQRGLRRWRRTRSRAAASSAGAARRCCHPRRAGAGRS